jgi:hypothetical protein
VTGFKKNTASCRFFLAGLRPLVLRVANGFTRNTGVVPVFAWQPPVAGAARRFLRRSRAVALGDGIPDFL